MVLSAPMLKKALTPISVIVLLIGIGLILYSTFGGDDSDDAPSSSEITLVDGATTVPGDSSAPGESSAPSGTTLAPGESTTVAPSSSTGAPGSTIFFPTFPTIVFPSSTFFIPSLPPSSFIVPSLPGVTLSPGAIDALTCNSFKNCAQKLYNAWKSNSKAIATNFATSAAVNTLFAFPYTNANGAWTDFVFTDGNPNVYAASCCAGTTPKRIEFRFVAGQTGFKVQSVQLS